MYRIKIDHMDLNQIANSGQCFRWLQTDEETYTIPAFGRKLTISQDGNLFTLSCDESEWNSLWKKYFDVDTDTDYDEAENAIMNTDDEFLKAAYRFGSGIRILRQDLWEVLISFIISQNNNIPRIKKSIEKLCNELDGKFPGDSAVLHMDLSDKGLGYRDNYLKAAALWWMREGEYTEKILEKAKEPKKLLMDIKGVGNKVADCICLFGLHRLDAFPVDTHIKDIINREYGGKMPEWVNDKYAGLYQQYIFYYELNHCNSSAF